MEQPVTDPTAKNHGRLPHRSLEKWDGPKQSVGFLHCNGARPIYYPQEKDAST